jgi:hypothetical protein
MSDGRPFKHFWLPLLFAVATLITPVGAMGHTTNGEQTYRDVMARGHSKPSPRAWFVLGRPRGDRVRIGTNVEWCPEGGSATRPRITGVQQVDRRRSVVLTAFLARRSVGHCGAVEILVEHLVHIRGGLRGRSLFDGSQSPPARRWPRVSEK